MLVDLRPLRAMSTADLADDLGTRMQVNYCLHVGSHIASSLTKSLTKIADSVLGELPARRRAKLVRRTVASLSPRLLFRLQEQVPFNNHHFLFAGDPIVLGNAQKGRWLGHLRPFIALLGYVLEEDFSKVQALPPFNGPLQRTTRSAISTKRPADSRRGRPGSNEMDVM